MIQITYRIFADHYQFYIFDSAYKHYKDERLSWSQKHREEFGYLSTEKAIYVSTVSDLNDHRLRIYLNEIPKKDDYERFFTRKIHLESGTLIISAPANDVDDDLELLVGSGIYKVFVCCNSVGKDMFSFDTESEDMEDEEYFTHDEYEYYDIYLKEIK